MILGTLRSIRRRLSGEHEFANVRAGTQTAAWYDWTYRGTPEYHGHYCDSSYYFLWTVIADRLTRQRYGKVLDLALRQTTVENAGRMAVLEERRASVPAAVSITWW